MIETPLDADLDVNGWELGKALKLILKGNAVAIEWLMSPVAYRVDGTFRDALLTFAGQYAKREMIMRHYLHLGQRQRRTYFGDGRMVRLKKIFYALRPATALRWLRLHPDAVIAPMHFPTLLRESDVSPNVAALVGGLMERKAVTRELGEGALPPPIEQFIDSEYALAQEATRERHFALPREGIDAANALALQFAFCASDAR